MLELLKFIGTTVKVIGNNKTIKLRADKKIRTLAPYNLVKTMRAGVWFRSSFDEFKSKSFITRRMCHRD